MRAGEWRKEQKPDVFCSSLLSRSCPPLLQSEYLIPKKKVKMNWQPARKKRKLQRNETRRLSGLIKRIVQLMALIHKCKRLLKYILGTNARSVTVDSSLRFISLLLSVTDLSSPGSTLLWKDFVKEKRKEIWNPWMGYNLQHVSFDPKVRPSLSSSQRIFSYP